MNYYLQVKNGESWENVGPAIPYGRSFKANLDMLESVDFEVRMVPDCPTVYGSRESTFEPAKVI